MRRPTTSRSRILVNPEDNRHLTDSRNMTALRYGPEGSWHDFGRVPLEKMDIIDYIFVKGKIEVLRQGILSEQKGALYPSDHYPVFATLIFD